MRWIFFWLAIIFAGEACAQKRQAAASSSDSMTSTSLHEKVTVRYAVDDFVPLKYESWKGGVFFKANVAGEAVWIVLDTGADYSVIDTSLVEQSGLTLEPYTGTVKSAFGETPHRSMVRQVSLEIPNQVEFKTSFVVMDLSNISKLLGRDIGMVLGRNITGKFALYIDTKRNEIHFRRAGSIHPKGKFAGLLIDQDGVVSAEVAGYPIKVKVDTGSNRGLSLKDSVWDKATEGYEAVGTHRTADVAGNIQTTRSVPSVPFKLGPIRTEISVHSRAGKGRSDGKLGMGFLHAFNILIDETNGKMALLAH